MIRILSLTWQKGRHGSNCAPCFVLRLDSCIFKDLPTCISHPSFRWNLSAASGTRLVLTLPWTPLVLLRNTGFSIYPSWRALEKNTNLLLLLLYISRPHNVHLRCWASTTTDRPHMSAVLGKVWWECLREWQGRQATNHQRITKPATMLAGGNVFTPWSLVTISQESCLWEINVLGCGQIKAGQDAEVKWRSKIRL